MVLKDTQILQMSIGNPNELPILWLLVDEYLLPEYFYLNFYPPNLVFLLRTFGVDVLCSWMALEI
jgi:hypothetical protein